MLHKTRQPAVLLGATLAGFVLGAAAMRTDARMPDEGQENVTKPTTTIVSALCPPALLAERDGKRRQTLQLTLEHGGDPTDATLALDNVPALALKIQPGRQEVEAIIPAVERTTSVRVTIQSGGRTVAERVVEAPPVRPFTVYLLPHSHVDIGYTELQTEVEKKQWGNLETAIDIAQRTAAYPQGARFRWNVEVMWAVDSYLRQASPEKQRAFVEAVQAGWVELDALYGNELTALCRPEELFRLVERAGQVGRRCGVPVTAAMISDVPGYTWGIVPVLAHAGVKYFCVGPNSGDRIGRTLAAWGDKPFWWVGPSGQERVLCWVAGKGYNMFHGGSLAQQGAAPILEYLQHLSDTAYPYDMVQIPYSTGGDNGPPDAALCDAVKEWNAKYDAPRIVIATTTELFRVFEQRYGDKLPRVSGDFTPYWEDGAGSSARETALNRAAAERLTQAETLFALRARDRYPAEEFAAAWRNAILYDEHTWGAYNSVSDPDAQFVKDIWRVKQAFALDAERQSSALLARAAASPAGRPATGAPMAIDVFNTSSWPRTDLVTWPGELGAGAAVMGPDGKPARSQRLADGALTFLATDVPPLGARRYTIARGAVPSGGQAQVQDTTLTTPALIVKIDPETGAIASLHSAVLDTEFVAPNAAVALNDYRYMLGGDVAGTQRNGPVRMRTGENGPLVASLVIESPAPGCRTLVREIRVIDGLDRVEIINTVDKLPVREKEGVHFGFAFQVPDGVMRMDVPWAAVRPEADQLPGACRNWFTVQRWVDISNDVCGVTWATPDAPLVEVGGLTADRIGGLSDPREWLEKIGPSQTLYSWAMNNHWHTNYRAEQEGRTVFRYAIRPHVGYDATAAQRFGVECSQPLIAVVADATVPAPAALVQVEPGSVLVTALRPSVDGQGLIVRLFNATDRATTARLNWRAPAPTSVTMCNLLEDRGPELLGPVELTPWGIVTLRAELEARGSPGVGERPASR